MLWDDIQLVQKGTNPVDTLKAILSRKWLTPDESGVSYREPASTYSPTDEKWPGVDSVTTRILLGRVVIRDVGSCCVLRRLSDALRMFWPSEVLVRRIVDGGNVMSLSIT